MRKLLRPRPHDRDLSPGLSLCALLLLLLVKTAICLTARFDALSLSHPAPLRMLRTLYDYFWWERLWLPVNLTWADLEDRDGRVYAKASDLYITLPLALLFLIIRYFFEL